MANITVELWNTANTAKIADLDTDGTSPDGVVSKQVASRRMAIAPASVVLRRDHPQAANCTRGKHLRWYVEGTHAHTTRIISKTDTRVSPQGPPGELVEVQSFSHAQVLSEALIRPYGGESFRPTAKARSLGAHAPETPTTDWPSAVLQYSGIASPIAGVPGFEPWEPPDGWPGPIDDVDWISFAAKPSDIAGQRPLRGTFTNPSTQDLWFCLSSDDGARMFLDGVEVIPWTVRYPGEGSFRSTWRQVVRGVSAGTHVWSVELEVLPGNPSGPRRGMVAAAVHKLPAAGSILGASTFVSGTTTAWKCRTAAGDFPACNPHQALAAILTDTQAETMAAGVTLTSTASVDSNGNAWNTEVPAALQIGSNIGAMLESWRTAGIAEWSFEKASMALSLFRPGGLGSLSSAVFTDAVDIIEDSTALDGQIINTLLVETDDGWELKQDSGSVASHGGVGSTLTLTDVTSASARNSAVTAFFGLEADPKTSRTVQLAPKATADLPGAFDAGDTITVDGDVVRVEMWSAQQSGKGLAEFDLELVTSEQIADERRQLKLDKLSVGTADGRAAVATLWQKAEDLPSGKLERKDFPVYSPDDDPDTYAPVVGTNKTVRASDGAVRVTTLEVKGLWTPAGDMPYVSGDSGPRVARTSYVAAVQRNGTNVASLTLDPDDFEKIVLIEDGLFVETDSYGIGAFGGVGFNGVTIRTTAVEAI